MSPTATDVAKTLETAEKQLQQELVSARKEFEQEQNEREKRLDLIRRTVAGLRGKPVMGSIGTDRLQIVKDYLEKKGRARQADIATGTKLNTGTVSVALRTLEDEGLITRSEKEKGSQVWVTNKPITQTEERETVVHVGDGVRSGRKRSNLKVAA